MNYADAQPQGHSAKFVKLYWELSYGRDEMSGGGGEPVLPDGCVEIIFDFRDRFVTYLSDGVAEVQPRSVVAGQLTSKLMIGPTGETDMFGVRLRSEAAFPLLGISMVETRDRIVDLRDVIGPIENELFEKLAATIGFESRIAVFEDCFIKERFRHVSPELNACVSILRSSTGSKPIRACAAFVNWSERHLERTFKEQIGLSPKLFARIIRFQKFLSLTGQSAPNLLDNALAAGYHDQSHMIRDFRHFAGVTPTDYFGRDLMLSGLFVEA